MRIEFLLKCIEQADDVVDRRGLMWLVRNLHRLVRAHNEAYVFAHPDGLYHIPAEWTREQHDKIVAALRSLRFDKVEPDGEWKTVKKTEKIRSIYDYVTQRMAATAPTTTTSSSSSKVCLFKLLALLFNLKVLTKKDITVNESNEIVHINLDNSDLAATLLRT